MILYYRGLNYTLSEERLPWENNVLGILTFFDLMKRYKVAAVWGPVCPEPRITLFGNRIVLRVFSKNVSVAAVTNRQLICILLLISKWVICHTKIGKGILVRPRKSPRWRWPPSVLLSSPPSASHRPSVPSAHGGTLSRTTLCTPSSSWFVPFWIKLMTKSWLPDD